MEVGGGYSTKQLGNRCHNSLKKNIHKKGWEK